HVVIYNDDIRAFCHEIVRGNALARVRFALDYFDASINRVAAWVIGTRNMIRALLCALLEPTKTAQAMEKAGNFTGRLAIFEEQKGLPFGAVWDYYCQSQNVPAGLDWLDEVWDYERDVLSKRP
ncbi:L-rhamnose isomerase, partial [bacterium]|nr:L-rhamnose isomerase [bacterium]